MPQGKIRQSKWQNILKKEEDKKTKFRDGKHSVSFGKDDNRA